MEECPVCGSSCADIHVAETWAGEWQSACAHGACAKCLGDWIDCKLLDCGDIVRIPCPAAGCQKYLPQKLVFAMSRNADRIATYLDEGMLGARPEIDKVCPICCLQTNVLTSKVWGSSDTGHAPACRAICFVCLGKWTDEHAEIMLQEKKIAVVPCLGTSCTGVLPTAVVRAVGSPEVQKLASDLEKRAKLQQNTLFPPALQVECRNARCVGLGYLGQEHIMCFVCEDQWLAEEPGPDGWEHIETAPEKLKGVKPCPECTILIAKDGGCDHMTCAHCKHQFYWTTLKKYP